MTKGFKVLFAVATAMLLVCTLVNSGFSQDMKRMVANEVKAALGEQPVMEAIGESEAPYTFGINDVVKIEVRNQPEFSGEYIVGPDGNIQYAYIGDVKASGLTKYELKDVLTKQLDRYVRGAEITISILAYRSKFVYMVGELYNPGQYPMKGDKVDLREAIFAADLPTRAAALRRVYVITPSEGKPKFKKVDIYKLLYEGRLKWNVSLAPGDVVVVPSTVPSEVNRALSNLLAPFTQAASSAVLYNSLTQ